MKKLKSRYVQLLSLTLCIPFVLLCCDSGNDGAAEQDDDIVRAVETDLIEREIEVGRALEIADDGASFSTAIGAHEIVTIKVEIE